MRTSAFLSFGILSSSVSATVYQGFNYGSTFTDGSAKVQSDFQDEFTAAQNLVGTSGAFTSARLYTMIQGTSVSDPIEAIPAAISTKTSLLLGIWASAGQATITNEIAALTAAIEKYGTAFTDLVVGLSVGSEDLYRVSPTGIENDSGVGAGPADIVNYVGQVKKAVANTPLSNVLIGHVDTWNSWVNGSNSPVIDAIDWLGVDEYPYFQDTVANSIDDAYSLFWAAYNATAGAAGGKPVWITETGWPVSGKNFGQGVPSLQNAQTFYDQVGCASAFGKVNTWWYVLQDAAPAIPNPSFGLLGSSTSDSTLGTQPLYDLSCANVTLPSSLLPQSSTASSTSTGSGSLIATPSSGSGTGTGTATAGGPSATASSGGAKGGSTSSGSSSPTKSSTTSSTSSTPTSNSASTVIASGSFLAYAMFAVAALF